MRMPLPMGNYRMVPRLLLLLWKWFDFANKLGATYENLLDSFAANRSRISHRFVRNRLFLVRADASEFSGRRHCVALPVLSSFKFSCAVRAIAGDWNRYFVADCALSGI